MISKATIPVALTVAQLFLFGCKTRQGAANSAVLEGSQGDTTQTAHRPSNLAGKNFSIEEVRCPEVDRSSSPCTVHIVFENGAFGLMSVGLKDPGGPESNPFQTRYYRFLYKTGHTTNPNQLNLEFVAGNKSISLFANQSDAQVSPWGTNFPGVAFQIEGDLIRGRGAAAGGHDLRYVGGGLDTLTLVGKNFASDNLQCPEADRQTQKCRVTVTFENAAYGLMNVHSMTGQDGRYYRFLFLSGRSTNRRLLSFEFVPGNPKTTLFASQTPERLSPWGNEFPSIAYAIDDDRLVGRAVGNSGHDLTYIGGGSTPPNAVGRNFSQEGAPCPGRPEPELCSIHVVIENGAYGLMSVTNASNVSRHYRFMYQTGLSANESLLRFEFVPGNPKIAIFEGQSEYGTSPWGETLVVAYLLRDGALVGRGGPTAQQDLRPLN